jgi:GNAT superfamily N-acetyltransferase
MSSSDTALTAAEYDPSRMKSQLLVMLDRWGVTNPESPHYGFWQSILDTPENMLETMVLAFDRGQVVGLSFANWRPYIQDGFRNVNYMIDDDQPEQAVGTVLKQKTDEIFRQKGLTGQISILSPEMAEKYGFIKDIGFREWTDQHVVRMVWDGADYSYEPVPGLSLHEYSRDNFTPGLDQKLADFYNRVFANEAVCTTFHAKDFRRMIESDDMWMVYALDDATGEIAAYTECTQSSLFSAIAVLRPYWGKGVAEWIGGHTVDLYRHKGFTYLWSIVRSRNHASIRLHERMGWHKDGFCEHFISDVSPD